MKTTEKTKTAKTAKTVKTVKAVKAEAAVKPKRVTSAKGKSLSEDDIRAKAQEIYDERIARGENGTASDDWHKAETILKGEMKK